MAERITRESDWAYGDFILKNANVAQKGEMLCIDTTTGTVQVGAASTTLVPIGYATESLTGDGVKKINVRFFKEKKMHWWTNDGTNPVLAANIGSNVYIVNATTVSISSATNTRSIAGRAWALDTKLGVLVEML